MAMIEYVVDGAVAIIRLDRPPVNALSPAFSAEILAAVERAADPGIRAVVIHGDPHFAAGADIKAFQQAYLARDAGEEPDADIAGDLIRAIRVMETLPKPVIAAIKGFALGGGLELAMGADFRYAGSGATLGQPEILLGLIPGAGGTQRLTRLVGLQVARELDYSGRHLPAAEALELGIVDKVFPDDEVLAAAIAQAHVYAAGPTKALAAAKRAITEGFGRPIAEAMEIEGHEFGDLFWTADAREGVFAFVEKRKAEFTGE